jgi:hypothetical protein
MRRFLVLALLAVAIGCEGSDPSPTTYDGCRVLSDAEIEALPEDATWELIIERFGRPARTAIAGIGCYLRRSAEIDYVNDPYEKVWSSCYLVSGKDEKVLSIMSSDGTFVWPKSMREKLKKLEEDEKKATEPGATDNPDDAQRLREDH